MQKLIITAIGCRAGDSCLFLHDLLGMSEMDEATERKGDDSSSIPAGPSRTGGDQVPDRRQAVSKPLASRVVSKPVPISQIQGPREFQLGQIRRRYSPKETRPVTSSGSGESTVLDFSMTPSDPDFPFEMDTLQCSLIVPSSYPSPSPESRPRLRVKNKDIPRGFAINIEKGFDRLVGEREDASLLNLMSALDKNLESFLSEKKAETIKLVANADKRHLAALSARPVGVPSESALAQQPAKTPSNASASEPVEVFTVAQRVEAQRRRETEIRQLEARLGRMELFKKSDDGLGYTLPIEPRRRSELPKPLQAVRTVKLTVPQLYPLQVCRIRLEGIEQEEARLTETAFEKRAREAKEINLMSHINYLAQNMHLLAKSVPKSLLEIEGQELQEVKSLSVSNSASIPRELDDDRSHIKAIPRPLEWTSVDLSDASESDDDYSGNESEDGGVDLPPSNIQMTGKSPEQGTAISFPLIELYGIELLEVTILNLTVKCERCKDTRDFNGLRHNMPKSESCRKCACTLTVVFRCDLIHANAVRAGFLDFVGCQVTDMLPSTFIPTCSNCSTPYPPPGVISVRGEATTTVCRSCYQKLTFKIPDVKFLRITPSAVAAPSSGPRRKRETLGLTAGTELPGRGRCKHYAKSYRWFRFSCCDKVYPCDKCHDEKEEHANEHGNRMICGWCSREQPYRPEDCGLCRKGVVGRKGSGFWEGGKGTRDQVRMSRKDPRKHKRIGAAKAP
jgi:uncharacterized CHY-type Zn-finger protein